MKKLHLIVMLTLVAMAFSALTVSAQDDPLGVRDDDRFAWDSLAAFEGLDLGGEEILFFGPWETDDLEYLNNVLAYLNAAVTNGSVTYVGSGSFEQEIVIQCEGGNPPHLAAFPQPGLAADMAARGCLTALGDDVRDFISEGYAGGDGWNAFATYSDSMGEDQLFGIWYNVNLKSLVWYVPDNFEENGYEIPTSWDELIALSDQIVADGGTPWCIGIGSGAATGWPATDWVEDIMLRTQPLSVYQDWATNAIPFTDERIVNALDIFGSIALNDAYVNGGTTGILTTDFQDSPLGLFSVPPECYMHRQASFIAGFFPDDVEVGVDAEFFYFPAIDPEFGNAVLGGGTVVTISNDTPGARAVLDFLMTPLAHELWMAQAGFLSPHKGINLDIYSSDLLRRQAEILLGADVFGFDGSDLMPGAIGAGAFWTGMVDFIGGSSSAEVAQAVQNAWDAISGD